MYSTAPAIRMRAWLTALIVLSTVISVTAVINAEDITSATTAVMDAKYTEISAALNDNNWAKLKSVLGESTKAKSFSHVCEVEAPLRFLQGHASLATGANTNAVSCFYCPCDSTGSASLQAWKTWTGKLIADNKVSVSASMHYLRGDALARNSELKEAIGEFDAALAIDPGHVLALNARGVTKWLLFEQDSSLTAYELGAVKDFMAASKADSNFADAWANRGLVGLRDFSAFKHAKEMFERAVTIDSTYWLALNGEAVSAGVAGEYWEFQKAIDSLMRKAPNTPYVQINAAVSGDKRISPGARGASQMISDIGNQMVRVGSDPAKWVGGLMSSTADLTKTMLNQPEVLRFEQSNAFAKTIIDWGRGGVFMFVKDGENLDVAGDGKPRLSGTWFTLNYPLTTIETKGKE